MAPTSSFSRGQSSRSMSYSQSVYYKLTPQRFVQTVDSLLAPGEINGLDASNLLCWTSNSALQGSCKADSDTTEGRNKGSALHGRGCQLPCQWSTESSSEAAGCHSKALV